MRMERTVRQRLCGYRAIVITDIGIVITRIGIVITGVSGT